MFCRTFYFDKDLSNWNVSKVNDMSHMFNSSSFNQNIGKWPINKKCKMKDIFKYNPISKKTFEGKIYGNRIAEYFNLENPNEFLVWEPYSRWKRRKNAVVFFSSISKLDINKVNENQKTSELVKLFDIDDNIYKEIVSFI